MKIEKVNQRKVHLVFHIRVQIFHNLDIQVKFSYAFVNIFRKVTVDESNKRKNWHKKKHATRQLIQKKGTAQYMNRKIMVIYDLTYKT